MRAVRRERGKGYLDSDLWVPKEVLNVEGTKRALTFDSPGTTTIKYYKLYVETEHHLIVPREFWRYNRPRDFDIVDCRPSSFEQTEVSSRIILDWRDRKDFTQRQSVKNMLLARGGVLQLACGKGKTVCALELIAQLKVPAIIIVDNSTLLDQWAAAIEEFLDVPGGVGRVEGSKFDWEHPIVLATYQTLSQKADRFSEEFRRYFGVIIWDEGHHIGAETFSKTANLFYGRRYCLTATPERKDGMHIVQELHVGPVLYKNLAQDLKPHINFRETGFAPNTADPSVVQQIYDARGELHYGMLAGFFGRWPDRLHFVLNRIGELLDEGRKILVLSNSIEELVNLLSLWNGLGTFYSDIPEPTLEELDPPANVQEACSLDKRDKLSVIRTLQRFLSFMPSKEDREMRVKTVKDMEKAIKKLRAQLEVTPTLLPERQRRELDRVAGKMACDSARRRLDNILKNRQEAYLKEAMRHNSNAGLMIHDVPRETRLAMLHDKQITFSIAKYGREGLDSQELDTVVILEPGSQKGWIQQVMGRALRMKPEKKEPLIEIFEDDVSLMHNICHNLRRHLREWPVDEGGPYYYDIIRAVDRP